MREDVFRLDQGHGRVENRTIDVDYRAGLSPLSAHQQTAASERPVFGSFWICSIRIPSF